MRCTYGLCRKKITLTETHTNTCRCKGVYCSNHLNPTVHSCSYDYVMEGQQRLKQILVPVSNDKIIKI